MTEAEPSRRKRVSVEYWSVLESSLRLQAVKLFHGRVYVEGAGAVFLSLHAAELLTAAAAAAVDSDADSMMIAATGCSDYNNYGTVAPVAAAHLVAKEKTPRSFEDVVALNTVASVAAAAVVAVFAVAVAVAAVVFVVGLAAQSETDTGTVSLSSGMVAEVNHDDTEFVVQMLAIEEATKVPLKTALYL